MSRLEQIVKHLDYATFEDECQATRFLLDLESDCRWAMSMLVNGIEGRLVDIHDGDFDKVLKAARRMPAFKRAQAWLEAHPEQGKEPDHDRVTRSLGSGH